jgi:hypothetical protein
MHASGKSTDEIRSNGKWPFGSRQAGHFPDERGLNEISQGGKPPTQKLATGKPSTEKLATGKPPTEKPATGTAPT